MRVTHAKLPERSGSRFFHLCLTTEGATQCPAPSAALAVTPTN